MIKHGSLEERIFSIGKEIYAHIQGKTPSIFNKNRWKGKLMEWAMRDDHFRTQLLRFIDVLPVLKTDNLVVKIMKEYFTEDVNTPKIISWGVKRLSKIGIIPKLSGKVIRANVESFSRQFIAGKDPKDALKYIADLRNKGFTFGVDLLGEVVLSDKEANEYVNRYLGVLDFFNVAVAKWKDNPILDNDNVGEMPRVNISLKISSLYSQLNPMNWEGSIELTKTALRQVLRKANAINASVTLDMEHYYLKNITIAIFKSIFMEEEFKDLKFVGIAIQAYLKDTKRDLLDLISWCKDSNKRITVRLVKGAYWDYETIINKQKGWPIPVFLSKEETDQQFEELTALLLNNTEWISPAIASHNIRSISNAIALIEPNNKGIIEFQFLYGMAEPIRNALQSMGYRVRIYTPIGKLLPGMAYFVRRILENTSNESFLRKSFSEEKPFDELIKAPRINIDTPKDDTNIFEFNNHPLLDFSIEENRQKMKNALSKAKNDFNKNIPLFIDNTEIWTEKEILSVNPANPDEIIGRVSAASKNEVEKAIQISRNAWQLWKRIPAITRADYLFRTAEEMKKRQFELASLEVYEVGKSWSEADGDIAEAIDHLNYYGSQMLKLAKPITLWDYPGENNKYFYEPKGVGVIISPWNFPLAISTGMVAACLVTGNCAILKPSSLSPVTAWKLIELFNISGLPSGVLQFLPGYGKDIGDYLVSHKDVDIISFTGSVDVGLRIIKLAAETNSNQRNVKKVIAEMGGKNAIIVDETADLDEAVKGVLESALGFQGQKCSACSRVIVLEDIYVEFTSRLKDAVESITIGSPEDPANFMGPVIDENSLKKVNNYINLAKSDANPILIKNLNEKGYFVGPAIFSSVNNDSPILKDEIFGPVLVIIKVSNLDEAINIANNTNYALTGGIYSRSPNSIYKLSNELEVGNLYINRKITGAIVARQPFGGYKMSGIGSKAGGPDYLLQFMNPKTSTENTLRRGFAPS